MSFATTERLVPPPRRLSGFYVRRLAIEAFKRRSLTRVYLASSRANIDLTLNKKASDDVWPWLLSKHRKNVRLMPREVQCLLDAAASYSYERQPTPEQRMRTPLKSDDFGVVDLRDSDYD